MYRGFSLLRGFSVLILVSSGGHPGLGSSPFITHEDAMLTATNGGVSPDQFGASVDIAGDVVVVGAPQDESSVGAAYIFGRDVGGNDNWGLIKMISEGSGNADFGASVAIDGSTLVVGAPFQDNAVGTAYIFEKDQGGTDNWGLVKQLVTDDGVEFRFGLSVAISGDRVAVASPEEFPGATYVFRRDLGDVNNWGQEAKLEPVGGNFPDWLNISVAITEDPGSDNVFVAVGAPLDTASANGSAFVFEKNEGGTNAWGQKKVLIASDSDDQSVQVSFGTSVSLDGLRLGIGARSNSVTGAVYLFERGAGPVDDWQEIKMLLPQDATAGDGFGRSVHLDGDRLVVGAIFEDSVNDDNGSIYVYERDTDGSGAWGQSGKIPPSAPSPDDSGLQFFGTSVASEGSILVVGGSGNSVLGGGDDEGSARIYSLIGDTGIVVNRVGALALLEDQAGEFIDLATAFAGLTDPNPVFSLLYNAAASNLTGQMPDLVAPIVDNADDELGLILAQDAFGFANLVMRATNDDPDSFEATFLVEVLSVNDEPSADSQTVEAVEDVPLPITLTGDDGDPVEIQALSFMITALPSTATLSESEGGEAISGTPPFPLGSDMVYFLTGPNDISPQSFDFQVMDNGGTENGGIHTSQTATVTINVTPVNDDPIAVDDVFTVSEDVSAELLDLLANDSSANPDAGETLTILALGIPSQGGVVTLGSVLYTPMTNFFGVETFTYRISDGSGQTATGQVTVNVTPNFGTWQEFHFSSATLAQPELEATVWGDLADPDGDRIGNLIEYFMGLNPQTDDRDDLLTFDLVGSELILVAQRAVGLSDVGGVFEWSTDLVTWLDSDIIVNIVPNAADIESLEARLPVGANDLRKFLRLRVFLDEE